MKAEATGALLLEALRASIRKNKKQGDKIDALMAEFDQIKQRLLILEEAITQKNLGPGT